MATRLGDLFGKPGEGLHKYRVLGFAAVDFIVVIGAAVLISFFMHWNFVFVMAGLIIIGVAVHRVLKVDTTLNVMIYGPTNVPS